MVLEAAFSVDVLTDGASRISCWQGEVILVISIDVLHGVLYRGVVFATLRMRATMLAVLSKGKRIDIV